MDDQDQSRQQKNEMVILSIIFVALFCICILVLVAVFLIYTRSFNTISADPNFFMPATPTPSLCPAVPSGWIAKIDDSFNGNSRNWPTEFEVDEYVRSRTEIVDGIYRIQATAKRGHYNYDYPSMDKVNDFYLQADVQQVEGPRDSEYGIVFRITPDGDFYFFGIQDSQRFVLDQLLRDEWNTLIPVTYSPIIKPGEPNQLTVFAKDSNFSLCVNQFLVAEIEDTDITTGKAGFSYSLYNEGDEAHFEFDNFQLYVPVQTE